MIGAAVSAAATAVASARPAPPPDAANTSSSAPRRLNDRKVPDFWEDKPDFWFRIFDAHLAHFNPTERRCFDALLPLLTPAARAIVHSVIRAPGVAPYTRAREALLRHFGRTPRQLARDLREARSLGDKLPSEFLDHAMSLLPDVKAYFEIVLLDALPPNARIAALNHTDLRAMARAADAVVLESRAAAESDRASAAVAALSLDQDVPDEDQLPSDMAVAQPAVAAVARSQGQRPSQRKSDLCFVHKRWGKEAYRCVAPNYCKMRTVIKQRPATPASGNGRAGSQ